MSYSVCRSLTTRILHCVRAAWTGEIASCNQDAIAFSKHASFHEARDGLSHRGESVEPRRRKDDWIAVSTKAHATARSLVLRQRVDWDLGLRPRHHQRGRARLGQEGDGFGVRLICRQGGRHRDRLVRSLEISAGLATEPSGSKMRSGPRRRHVRATLLRPLCMSNVVSDQIAFRKACVSTAPCCRIPRVTREGPSS